jgi:hypothetical protein
MDDDVLDEFCFVVDIRAGSVVEHRHLAFRDQM